MYLPSNIAELPTPAVDLITATDGAGGAVMVFDANDRIIWANPAQRTLMPCGNYDVDETYESLFWKLLESGLNGNSKAQIDPRAWLAAAVMTRRCSPNLNFVNKYRGRNNFVTHLLLEDGTSIQARIDVDSAGLTDFLGEFGGSGITFALRCKERMDVFRKSLDSISLAIAVVDAHGHLLLQNASFREMIEKDDALRISEAAGLTTIHSDDGVTLYEAIRKAANGATQSTIVPILLPDRDPDLMTVAPGPRPGTATLILSRFGEDEQAIISQIRQTLGTTPAEAEVAYAIGAGRSVAEIAELRNTSEATVYTQLKHIRAALRATKVASADLAGIAALVNRVAAITRSAITRS